MILPLSDPNVIFSSKPSLISAKWEGRKRDMNVPLLNQSGSSYSPFEIRDFMTSSSSSSKGNPPQSRVYRMIPNDQISASIFVEICTWVGRGISWEDQLRLSSSDIRGDETNLLHYIYPLSILQDKHTPSSHKKSPTIYSL